jgi:serine protease
MAADPRAPGPQPPDTSGGGEYPRRVIIRFRPSFQPKKDRLEPRDLPGWDEVLRQFPSLTPPRRLVPSQTDGAKAIEKLVSRAKQRDPNYKPAPFEQYYVVDVPRELAEDAPVALVEALSHLTVVEQAYVESRPFPPPSTMTAPAVSCIWNQLHLKPAPVGIDAEYAWTQAGGEGQLQGFVDIEWGWGMTSAAAGGQVVSHAALQSPQILLLAGRNEGFEGHGTRALGVVAADLLTNGVRGITPSLARIACVGQWRPAEPGDTVDPVNDIGRAISVAADSMQPGDVLLLEAQGESGGLVNVAIESESYIWNVIKLATSAGIVVIEPAGNGNVNIDPLLTADSGAIIVGAAEPGSCVKTNQSCYGTRVHCYAWGNQVVTTDYHLFNRVDAYTQPCGPMAPFAGTSSAAAIIAGAALAVQGLAQAARGCRLEPAAVRAILSDPANATAAAAGAQIGVMPDLKKILTQVINTAALNAFSCA